MPFEPEWLRDGIRDGIRGIGRPVKRRSADGPAGAPEATITEATVSDATVSAITVSKGQRGAPPPYLPESVHDTELIGRILAGDPGAERELYDAHVDRVYRLAYRLTGDRDRAQDYTQDTFIKVFDNLHTFQYRSLLSTWIVSIALSVTLNSLRKVKRLHSRELPWDNAPEIGGMSIEADPDLKARLSRAIDDLPDGYRAVFVMHDVEGYTHEEIGAALGVQAGTSKAQLFRARARLRSALAEFMRE